MKCLEGSLKLFPRGEDIFDLIFVPHIDTGGSLGCHRSLRPGDLQNFLDTRLQLDLTPHELSELLAGKSVLAEISAENYRNLADAYLPAAF